MILEDCKLCFFEETSLSKESNNDDNWTKINSGKWLEVLQSEDFQNFLNTSEESFTDDEKLSIAIACLFTFTQQNFTGPDVILNENFLKFSSSEDLGESKWKLDRMMVDGIEYNVNMKLMICLVIAKQFLEDLFKKQQHNLLICIWYLRMLKTYQQSLDEDSITIYSELLKVHQILSAEKLQEIPNLRHRFLIQLELASAFLMYRRVSRVESILKQLTEQYQIEMIEQGALGVRTKWQTQPLPQFHVSIQQSNKELALASAETHKSTKLIQLLKLDDDTRLEMIKFMDNKQNELQHLSSTLQNFTLIVAKHLEISQPRDKLADEEILPYLRILLTQENGPWIVRLDSLVMNIKLESNHKRTVERCLRQCEELVAMINRNELNETPASQRLSYIYSSFMTPRYKMEIRLADLLISLGLVKGALDLYLKVHQWEDVIGCYTQLQLRHKAAEIIQQELSKQPTVKLYCMLGDATDDVSCYERAWEFSKMKSGVAQRHWGNYFYFKQDYENAIPHFQKSVEINSIQEIIWLRLGYSALSLEKYELAASAYVRHTQLEPSGFEAWNNLAKCYIKLGQKAKAHKVLNESLKCNFDNWKVWENFLLVSVDIGSFDDALNSYNRLIELKEKYFDEEVLKILISAISDNLTDVEGLAASRLRKKALELLAHLGSLYINEGIVWELSALLTSEPLKKAEKLQKAHKGYVSKHSEWTKDEKTTLKILKIDREICEYSLEATKNYEEREKMLLISQLSSARLTALGSVKIATSNDWESCRECVNDINKLLEQIVSKIRELK